MAIKKNEVTKKSGSLMSNQDTAGKGDAVGADRVMITFWVSPNKKQELKEYAKEHGVTQTHVLLNGLEWALSQK